jgi:hypothetical protein
MLEKFLVWSSKAFRRPWVAFVLAIIATVIFAFGVPKIKFDNSIKNMLPETNRDKVVHNYYEDPEQFGSSDLILIGIDTDDAYSEKTLRYVAELEAAVNDLNMTMPARNMAKLLGLSEADGGKVVDALKGVGIGEDNYKDTMIPLITSAQKLQSEFSWDAAFANKVARAAPGVSPDVLFQNFRSPIKKTQSLISADYIKFADDELKVEKLVPDGDLSSENIAALKGRVQSWSIYDKALVSSDGKLTSLVVTPNKLSNDLQNVLADSVAKLLSDKADPSFKVYLDGEAIIGNQITKQIYSDIEFLLPLVILVVLLILFLNFRTIQGVAYPAAIILVSVVCTVGLMAYLGVPLSVVGICVPVLLVAIVSAYGIHQMNHYFLDTASDKLSILDHNMKSVGLAISLSGITVMVGFGALATESFVPIKNFGIFTAIGDLVGVACALYLLPSMILLSRKPKHVFQTEKQGGWINSLLRFFDGLNRSHSKAVLIVSIALSVVAAIGIFSLKSELNNVSFFRKSTTIHRADDHLNERLAGTEDLNVVLDTDLSDPYHRGEKKADSGDNEIIEATTPEVLGKIDQFSADVQKQFPFATKVMSFNDALKKMNQEMNGGSASFYKIPDSKDLISQYLLIFTGDISDVLTSNHDKLRVAVTMKRVGSDDVEKVKQYCLSYFSKDFLEKNHLRVEITGTSNLYDVANTMLVDGMIQSIYLCIGIVFLLLVLVLRNFRMSLISILPIIVTLLLNFGLMGLFHIPLNVATALVSSIAIGIGVDYSIHFITWYRNELYETQDILLAIKNTIFKKGRGILYNMFVVFGGFLVLGVSSFVPLMQFGLLVAACMVFSATGALVIVPAIIRLLAKKDYEFLYLGTRKAKNAAD